MGSQRIRHDWATSLFIYIYIYIHTHTHTGHISWRRKWHPTPVFLPGKSRGWKSLLGYSPWGHKESDTTESIHFTSLVCVYIHIYTHTSHIFNIICKGTLTRFLGTGWKCFTSQLCIAMYFFFSVWHVKLKICQLFYNMMLEMFSLFPCVLTF